MCVTCLIGYSEPRRRRWGSSRRTAGPTQRTHSHWTLCTQVRSVFFTCATFSLS